MTRAELIEKLVVDYPGLTKKDLKRVVEAIFEAIMAGLENGDRVELRGFGSFEIRAREGRIGRNPRTGGIVPVAPKRHVRFRGSKQLQQRMTAARLEQT